MGKMPLFFGHNKHSDTSLDEYGEKWERIFKKKEDSDKTNKGDTNEKTNDTNHPVSDNQLSAGF